MTRDAARWLVQRHVGVIQINGRWYINVKGLKEDGSSTVACVIPGGFATSDEANDDLHSLTEWLITLIEIASAAAPWAGSPAVALAVAGGEEVRRLRERVSLLEKRVSHRNQAIAHLRHLAAEMQMATEAGGVMGPDIPSPAGFLWDEALAEYFKKGIAQ